MRVLLEKRTATRSHWHDAAAQSPQQPAMDLPQAVPQAAGNQAMQQLMRRRAYEEDAERIADRIMSGAPAAAHADGEATSEARSLPRDVRAFMEPRFGADFSRVRVHTGTEAAHRNRAQNARAFTSGNDIWFGDGTAPGTNAVTAHELAHVVQQSRHAGAPGVQHVIEVRPPGRGEATAFDRRQELIDRLNTFSTAIQYSLVPVTATREEIHHDVRDAAALTRFDEMMRDFIDQTAIIPMRLITSAGRVHIDAAGTWGPLLFDSFELAYVDLDDLLASEPVAMQLVLAHLLTERSSVRDYARRIGTGLDPLFARGHALGQRAEAEVLQGILNDPTLRFVFAEEQANALVVGFTSDEGYRVFHIIRRPTSSARGGVIQVLTADRRRISLDEFLAERAGAAAP